MPDHSDSMVKDGGWIGLDRGDDDCLRVTLFADTQTFIWIDFDDDDVDDIIVQMQNWRHHRRLGRKTDA